jgi:hypothetical protein
MTTLHTIPPRKKRSSSKSRKGRVILAACGTGLLPAAAFGAAVAPGARDVPLSGTSMSTAGEIVADLSATFSINDPAGGQALLAGIVENRVIREPAGTLTFHYKLTNTADSPDLGKALLRFTAFGFSPLLATDVDYRLGIGSAHPSTVTRNNEVVDFRFTETGGTLAPGASTEMLIRTDAIDFETGGFGIADVLADTEDQNGSAIGSAMVNGTFKPIAPVIPLPAAVYSGAIGLATIVAVKRKKWV